MRRLTNTCALIASISLVLCACSPSQPPDEETSTEGEIVYAVSVDSVVEQKAGTFFKNTPQAVGLSIGVIVGDDIRTYHYGSIAPGSVERPSDTSIYGIASVTKTFTGVLLAHAARDRRLGLHDDIRVYLDGGYPNLEKSGYPITLVQLINHTSGLPNTLPDRPEMYPDYPEYEGDVWAWVKHTSTVFADYTQADFLDDLHTVALDTIPGTWFSYSNAGPQLAGFILERVYQQSFEAVADSLVFRPLNMRSTGISLPDEEAGQLLAGYDETGNVMPPVLEAYGAAGALKSTVVDLAKYVQWHLDEQDPIVKLSHTPPGAPDLEEGFALGLNWQMARSEGVKRIWQDGNAPGYSSRVLFYPALDLGVVVLANQLDRSIPQRIDQLADAILESIDERTFTLMEAL